MNAPMKKVLSLALAFALTLTAFGFTPISASADGGCAHVHDAACGYAEAAPCGHVHDENCGWDEDAQTGCTHDCTDGTCGYVEAAPCNHVHDENCGEPALGGSGETTPPNAVTFTFPDDGYGETTLYLTEGIAVTDADLLLGVTAADENDGPVAVSVQDSGGMDTQNPQMRGIFPNPPYIITYAAAHPVSGDVFTATRECYVTLGTGDIQPLAASYTWSGAPPAVADGDTVTVTGTSSGTLTVPAGATVTINGNVAASAPSIALTINAGATVKWAATYVGTGNPLINITGTGIFEVVTGASIYNSGTGMAVFTSNINSPPSIIVSGGTVAATSSSAIFAYSNVNMTGGSVSAITGRAINCIGSANPTVTIGGGTVEATGSGGYAVYTSGNVSVTGGKVAAVTGNAIYASGTSSTVAVSGGEVSNASTTSSAATIYNTSSTGLNVTVSGTGKVKATAAGGWAVYTFGDVSITGGEVSSTTGRAVSAIGKTVTVSGGTVSATTGVALFSGTVTVNGGFVFAYGSGITGTANVINATVSYTLNSPEGDGVVAAWNNTVSPGPFNAGDTTGLTIQPSGGAEWNNYGANGGIYYQNSTNGGFFLLPVIVNGGEIDIPPTLSYGSVTRTNDAAATIGFTTDKAGTAYYLVLDSGAPAPTSAEVKAGTSLGAVMAGPLSGLFVTLTAGAKDIYVVVEGMVGNISAPLRIAAPAFGAQTYSIAIQTNGVLANGVTAAGTVSPASPQAAGTGVTVTITLTGTATVAGTHTVGLTSATLGAGITAPGTVTKMVAAGQNMTAGDIFVFTFTMPGETVDDFVVTHSFIATPPASGFVVTTISDSGAGSLRAAINYANSQPNADTITFDPATNGQIITLLTELPDITEGVTISGNGEAATVIVGPVSARHFRVNGAITVTFEDLTLKGPASPQVGWQNGGVIANTGSIVNFNRCTLTGNSSGLSSYGKGGAVEADTLNMTDCTVSDNMAINGGGVHAVTATLTNCAIFGNTTTNGGGGAGVNATTAVLTNCTLFDNSASSHGGGIYATYVTLTNCTVTGNAANYGGPGNGSGGGFCAGIAQIYGSIISGNTANDDVNVSTVSQPAAAPSVINYYSIIGTPEGHSLAKIFGTAPPALADNGGPTKTILIDTNGPAHNGILAVNDWTLPATDQRGAAKPQGAYADIGAVELAETPPVGMPPTITTTTLPSGIVGTAYRAALVATGDVPIIWTLDSGNLPDGLTLNGTTGEISGTPTADGMFSFTVKAENSTGNGTASLSITIDPAAVKFVTVGAQSGTLAAGTAGTVTFPVTTANIANGSYTATVANLPTGITVSGQVSINNGSGILTLAGDANTTAGTTETLTLTIDGTTSNSFGLVVSPAPTYTTAIIIPTVNGNAPAAPVSNPAAVTQGTRVYLPTVTASAGFVFINWTVASGGVTITNPSATSTAYFVMGTQNVAINANFAAETLSFGNQTLPDGTYGTAYSANVTAPTGGSGTYTYSATVPAGLAMATDGAITGTPTDVVTAQTFTVTVTDMITGATENAIYTITIAKAAGPASPVVGKIDETGAGANNGTITGVNDTMEYKLSTNSGWTDVGATETTITNLAPGTYWVRIKETATAEAGANAVVVLDAYSALTGTATINNTSPKIGDTLSASLNSSNSTGILTYKWMADGMDVGTAQTYTVDDDDLDKVITVTITSTNPAGSKTSASTAAVVKRDYAGTPAAPVVESKTNASITLMAVAGYEYAYALKNAAPPTTFASATTFSGLTANTEYTVYQRVAETVTTLASAATSLDVTTNVAANQSQAAPAAPTLVSRTTGSITLGTIANNANGAAAEYSRNNGTTWQDSPNFTGLSAGTSYSFVARYKAVTGYDASPNSPPASFATETAGGNGNGGNSGNGGGNSGASGSITITDNAVPLAPTPVIAATWLEPNPAETLANAAKAAKQSYARTRSTGTYGVRGAAWQRREGLQYQHDTVADGAVQVRLCINSPEKLTKDTLVSGYVKGDAVDSIKAIFEKWFKNKLRVIHMDQTGSWGQPVHIAARVDLTGMDTKNLYFYAYDRATNTYKRIEKPAYWIDANGYLRFTTEYAGDIIISDGALVPKGQN